MFENVKIINVNFMFWIISVVRTRCISGTDENQAPTANAGGDQTVFLPADLVVLNGSRSTDDHGIISFKWTRDSSSPAAGVNLLQLLCHTYMKCEMLVCLCADIMLTCSCNKYDIIGRF
jgi:hypothetical protein